MKAIPSKSNRSNVIIDLQIYKDLQCTKKIHFFITFHFSLYIDSTVMGTYSS